jgi:tRNA (guanine10-N2)-dimethyltransferase
LLDPFCGTGGILIEAGLIGAKVIGIDIKKKMIEGCKKNLEHYGIYDYSLRTMDMRDACSEKVDSIVSDFPYGRSTYTGDALLYLYDDAFRKLKELLNTGRRAVIGVPHKDFIAIGEQYFELEEVYALRVHRSLTRYFCVYYLDTN